VDVVAYGDLVVRSENDAARLVESLVANLHLSLAL
jgi:hypothetical protein